MKVILGFDPGGAGKFGWAIANDAQFLPMTIVETGHCSSSEEALAVVRERLTEDQKVIAAGIDAPMFWTARGSRRVDDLLRDALGHRHCPSLDSHTYGPS